MKLGFPCSAISKSPDGALVAVGGRDVRILSLRRSAAAKGFTLSFGNPKALRTNRRFNDHVSDVVWHPDPNSANWICTVPLDRLVLWDLRQAGAKRLGPVLTSNGRAINRACWHPADPHLLLSADQDGKIQVWDTRTGQVQQTFSDYVGVRDVKVNPLRPNAVCGAYDNGSLQLWDLRKEERIGTVNAHQSLSLSVDWHPTQPFYIASAGGDRRDMTIKVWDVSTTPVMMHKIQSSASVGRIKWRPGHRWELASSATLNDHHVYLWDCRRCYIPIAIYCNFASIVPSFEWHQNGDHILAVSKVGELSAERVEEGTFPFQRMCTTAVSWSIDGNLAHVTAPVDRHPNVTIADEAIPSVPLVVPLVVPPPVRSSIVPKSLSGPFNALVSLSPLHRATTLAPPAPLEVDVQTMRPRGSCTERAVSPPTLVTVWNSDKQDHTVLFARHYCVQGKSLERMCSINAKVATEAKASTISQMWRTLQLLFSATASNLFSPGLGDDKALARDRAMRRQKRLADSRLEWVDGLGGDSSKISSQMRELNQRHINNPHLPRQAHFQQQARRGKHGKRDAHSKGQRRRPPSAAVRARRRKEKGQQTVLDILHSAIPVVPVSAPLQLAQALFRGTGQRKPPFREEIVMGWVNQAAEDGDVQTCVCLVLVLKGRMKFPAARVRRWLWVYWDLLRRKQEFGLATEVLELCGEETGLRKMNKMDTSFLLNCHCGKRSEEVGGVCDRCHKAMATCSLCQCIVNGVYVWCQGCGHGGHLHHMRDWFADNQQCPTGCLHQCVFDAIPTPGLPEKRRLHTNASQPFNRIEQ